MQHLLHFAETEDQTTMEASEKSPPQAINDAKEQKPLPSPKEGRPNFTSSVLYL